MKVSYPSLSCQTLTFPPDKTEKTPAECLLVCNAKARLGRIILFVVFACGQKTNAMQCRCSTTRGIGCINVIPDAIVFFLLLLFCHHGSSGIVSVKVWAWGYSTWRCYWGGVAVVVQGRNSIFFLRVNCGLVGCCVYFFSCYQALVSFW